MKKLFIITMLVFTINITVFSAETPKQKKIKELFQVMDIQAATNEMSEMILNDTDSMKLSKNQKAAMQKEMQSMMDYVLNKQAELYDRHFTEQEIVDLLKFYNTSTGKKMIEKTPTILEESMEIGRKWGIELAQKIEKEIPVSTKSEYSSPPPPMNTK